MRFYAHGRRTSLGGGPLFLIAYMIGMLFWMFIYGFVLLVKAIVWVIAYYQKERRRRTHKIS
jgi:hypothetical protein